jgi:ABC-2 type transport system permease protein
MLSDIIRFEWRYHTRQVTFFAAAALFFLFGFAITASGFGPNNVNINSPFSIVESVGLLSLPAVFILAVFCANAIVRDREQRMEEVVFGTAVQKFQLLFGRFTGSFLAAFTAFIPSALGMIVASQMPWQDPARVGTIHPVHYLVALVIVALPNLLFGAVLLFCIAALTRSTLASYTGAVLIYVLYWVAAAFTNSPMMAASSTTGQANASLSALLDPFALSAFFEQTQFWTAARRNSEIVSLTGTLLLNRILWLSIGAALWGATYRLFTFGLLPERIRRAKTRAVTAARNVAYEPLAPSQGWRAGTAAALSAFRIEARASLRTLPFAGMVLLWMVMAFSEMVSSLADGEYGSSIRPLMALTLGTLERPFELLVMVILIYFSAEVVWRERQVRFADVTNATPTPSLALAVSKWLTLVALVMTFVVASVVTALAFQLSRGAVDFNLIAIGQFAWFNALPLILLAALMLLLQRIAGNKYAGMMLSLAAAVVITRGPALRLEHHLLRFSTTPGVAWSAMNGTLGATGFNAYALLWSAVAALLIVVAAALWRTPLGGSRIQSIASSIRSMRTPQRTAIFGLIALASATAAFIAWNTIVVNEFVTNASMADWKASYEKRYRPLASLPQPHIAHIAATVDLRPEDGGFHVRGRYTLVNVNPTSIARLIVVTRNEARDVRMSVDGARLAELDPKYQQRIFTFDPPLAPGHETKLDFELDAPQHGFGDDTPDRSIVGNGSVLMNFRALPSIGYRASYELSDPDERRRHGLARMAAVDESELTPADSSNTEEWTTLDLTVSTAPDQTVVAPGHLERSWTSDGRHYSRFISDKPIRNTFAMISARYEKRSVSVDGVAIETYFDRAHAAALPRVERAAVEAVSQLNRRIGVYPHPTLRLAEVPSYWPFGGFAMPGEILLSEERVFLVEPPSPSAIDLVTRRVAHEVAHQWWGHTVVAANLPGSSVITESLTKDAELLVVRQLGGVGHVRAALSYELDRYLRERVNSRKETGLLVAASEPFLYYRKGAIVMHAIRDLLGDERMDRALRGFVATQGGPGHLPTTTHLLAAFEAEASPQERAAIRDWMTTIALYDYKLDDAAVTPRADGRFDVRLTIAATKVVDRGNGVEAPVGFHDDVAIGLFDSEIDDPAQPHVPLHLARHPLHDGSNTLTITVDRKPRIAAIDPYFTRIDSNPDNNAVRVK